MTILLIDYFNDETEARAWALAHGGVVKGPFESLIVNDHTVDPPQLCCETTDGTYWVVCNG